MMKHNAGGNRSRSRTTASGASRRSAWDWQNDGGHKMADLGWWYGRRMKKPSHGAAVGGGSLAGTAADGKTSEAALAWPDADCHLKLPAELG